MGRAAGAMGVVPEQAGKKRRRSPGSAARGLRLGDLFFELLDAHGGVVERVFLHEQRLHEPVGRAGLAAGKLADELFGFLILGGGVRRAQTIEQAGDEIAFLGGHK